MEPLEHSAYKATRSPDNCGPRICNTPDSRYVLGPLAVQGLCSFLQLVQLVLDLFGLILIPQVLGHGLHIERHVRFWL